MVSCSWHSRVDTYGVFAGHQDPEYHASYGIRACSRRIRSKSGTKIRIDSTLYLRNCISNGRTSASCCQPELDGTHRNTAAPGAKTHLTVLPLTALCCRYDVIESYLSRLLFEGLLKTFHRRHTVRPIGIERATAQMQSRHEMSTGIPGTVGPCDDLQAILFLQQHRFQHRFHVRRCGWMWAGGCGTRRRCQIRWGMTLRQFVFHCYTTCP